MAEETSENSRTTDSVGRFGEMPMDAQIATAAGIGGIVECVSELPEASSVSVGKTYQLTAVQPPYIMGRFYKCIEISGNYEMREVSAVFVQEITGTNNYKFTLNNNELSFEWGYPSENWSGKTEIQLVYFYSGSVRAVKTIFTESNRGSYPDGAKVIVDENTRTGITNGRIGVRAVHTHINSVYVVTLNKVAEIVQTRDIGL